MRRLRRLAGWPDGPVLSSPSDTTTGSAAVSGAATGVALAAPTFFVGKAHAATEKLNIGIIPAYSFGIYWLVQDQGFAPGVEMDFSVFPSGPPAIEAMVGGSVDAITVGSVSPLAAMARNVADFREISVCGDASGLFTIVGRPGMTSLADLEGKRIAVTSGSNFDFFLGVALEQAGLSDMKLTRINMEPIDAQAALIAGAQCSVMAHEGQISGRLDGAPKVPSDWVVKIDGRTFEVELGQGGATVDGEWIAGTTDWQPGMVLAAANGNGENLAIQLRRTSSAMWALTTRGKTHKGLAVPARLAPLLDHMIEKEPPDLSKMLICPMPGLLVKLHVAEGDEVQPGQPLATVEAMKMENILRAEKEGTISSINAAEGDSLAVDEVILELE